MGAKARLAMASRRPLRPTAETPRRPARGGPRRAGGLGLGLGGLPGDAVVLWLPLLPDSCFLGGGRLCRVGDGGACSRPRDPLRLMGLSGRRSCPARRGGSPSCSCHGERQRRVSCRLDERCAALRKIIRERTLFRSSPLPPLPGRKHRFFYFFVLSWFGIIIIEISLQGKMII